MKNFISSVEAVMRQISRIMSMIAVIFLLILAAITFIDVFLRYFFNAPIPGSMELTTYCMIVAGFLGISWCAIEGGHLKIDMIIKRLPPRLQAITESITLTFGVTLVALVAWQTFKQANYTLLVKTTSDIIEIPDYPFYIVIGLSFTLLFFIMVSFLIKSINEASRK